MTTIRYDAPPILSKFLESNAFVRAVVGPFGSGKSSACVLEILRRATEQEPGPDGMRRTRFAVVRNTYSQLRDTSRKTFEQWIPDGLGTWLEAENTFHMKFADVDCEVLFRALDKPKDVKKVLSLELTGAYLNEVRELPKEVFDGLQGRVGRYPPKLEGGPTWYGVWADSNAWAAGSWTYKLFNQGLPVGFELFEQPGGLSVGAENVANLPDGYYERLCNGKDQEWIDEYVHAFYPLAEKGSVYGSLIAALEARGGVCEFKHPSDGIHATFDLGIGDSTAIWWWRIGRHGVPDIIDWYEASGEGASHYFEQLESRGYQYERIWLPHDARARSFQTGISTAEQFLKRYPSKIAMTPELSLKDGLGATRWMLEQPIRIHARCAAGLDRLRSYRFQWDDDKKCFSKLPLHDWTSHTADSCRYIACAVQASELMGRKPVEPSKSRVSPPPPPPPTLDSVFEASFTHRRNRL